MLTINADSIYLLKQDYIDKKDGHDEDRFYGCRT
nr:hypothetical protein [Prevotella sp.]